MKKIILLGLTILEMVSLYSQVVDEPDMRIFPSDNHQTEVHISINKRFPRTILVSANVALNSGGPGNKLNQGYYYSQDAGQTWTGADEMPNNLQVSGDPVTAFDANGDFHLVSMTFKNPLFSPPLIDGYYLFSSTNQGTSWSHLRGTGPKDGFDKPMAVFFDDQQGSPYENYFYCAWTQFDANYQYDGIFFNRSTNLSQGFQDSLELTPRNGSGTNVQTGPNGEVYVCWTDYENFMANPELGFAFSNDGGASFNIDFPFQYASIKNNKPSDIKIRVNDFPSMAVDRSCGEFRGKIYVAYPELNDQGNSVIHLRHSSDHGASFSDSPILISTSAVEQAFFPWVACDPVTGIVVITYYGLNPDFPQNITNTYVAYSSDGGSTFQNIKVSDVSHFSSEVDHDDVAAQYAGDYIGIDIYDGIAYAAWADSRIPGNLWQVYVSKLNLRSLADRIFSTTDNLVLDDVIFNDPGIIYRGNNISVLGNSQVNSNIRLQLIANNQIEVSPDFRVQNGGEFKAYIDPFSCQTPGFVQSRNVNLQSHSGEAENVPDFEESKDIIMYPNPVSDKITIECKTEKLLQLTVLNLFGAVIVQEYFSYPASRTTVDLIEFPDGPYLFEVITDQQRTFSQKIIIQK